MATKRPDALAVTYRPLKSLIPYARNARTHPPEQLEQIKGSLLRFGWTTPMAIAGSNMLAGHGRLACALALADAGLDIPRNPDPWQGPTIDLSHLSEVEQRAYILADNRIALNAGWDDSILRTELAALRAEAFDVLSLGFNEGEVLQLLDSGDASGTQDPDQDAPEAPTVPVTRPGDTWLLGRHRLACGDATNAADVARALNGVKPHLMVTDPPYGVEYDPKWRAAAGVNKSKGKMGAVLNDDRADWREAWKLFPGDVAYVWHAGIHSSTVHASLEAAGFAIRSQIIWAKDRFALSRGHYHWQHEPCWYAVRGTGHWHGDRSQSTLWSIRAREDSGVGHGTQKPVECMRRPIENNSSPGQAVYEPFSGSGTTLIAAHMTGRTCHAVELNPAYVDVGVLRWQTFAGEVARLESTGQTFADVAEERATSQQRSAAAAAE